MSRTAKSGGVVEEYAYDSQNRLVGYSSATSSASYTYDAMDRRIAKTVDGVTTAYIYDASSNMGLATDDILLEFQGDILTRRWLHTDAVDEPVGFEIYTNTSGAGSGAVHEVFADRQGSVITIADPVSGTIKAAYTYDSFGGLAQISGTVQQPYGYTGREFDAESGLYHYRARTYDPATGMFLQSDPIGFAGGDLNTYAYVGNDPFGWGDPSGLTGTIANTTLAHGGISQAQMATTLTFGAMVPLLYNILHALNNAGNIDAIPSGNALVTGASAPPPGNCSKNMHKRWQDRINRLGRLPGCQPGLPALENMRRMSERSALYVARTFMNRICFGGGDANHQIEAEKARKTIAKCGMIIAGQWAP